MQTLSPDNVFTRQRRRKLYAALLHRIHGEPRLCCGGAQSYGGNIGLDEFAPIDPLIALHRPKDISFAIDKVLEANESDDVFKSMINPDAVGVSGHSMGGYASVALSGAVVDIDYLEELCSGSPPMYINCGMLDQKDMLLTMADSRIKASIPMAPCISYKFGPNMEGISNITIPTMVMGGTQDTLCDYEVEQHAPFPLYGGPKYLLTMVGGGHVGFTDVFNDGEMDLERMWLTINTFAAAFFGKYLKDFIEYDQYLTPEYANEFAGESQDVFLK